MFTTNYHNTLILVAEDCRAEIGTRPEKPGTVAALQHQHLAEAPYELTSDDLIFEVAAIRKSVPNTDRAVFRSDLFSRPMACLRASPLVKTYGWGLHFDADGKTALVARESKRYAELVSDPTVEKVRGMRSKRA